MFYWWQGVKVLGDSLAIEGKIGVLVVILFMVTIRFLSGMALSLRDRVWYIVIFLCTITSTCFPKPIPLLIKKIKWVIHFFQTIVLNFLCCTTVCCLLTFDCVLYHCIIIISSVFKTRPDSCFFTWSKASSNIGGKILCCRDRNNKNRRWADEEE